MTTSRTTKIRPLRQRFIRRRVKPIIAYDLETTPIQVGTPDPLYITLRGDGFLESYDLKRGRGFRDLARILETRCLIPEHLDKRFVAWGGNIYDIYFVILALIHHGHHDWMIKPYYTAKKMFRGVIIFRDLEAEQGWEFLDGIAMTGCQMSLKKFGRQFAPLYPKKAIDVKKFDAEDETHVAYAERDSELLYQAITSCQERFIKLTGNGLFPTVGKAAIHYLASEMPPRREIYPPRGELRGILHNAVKRGGYGWLAEQYIGPTWKYDLNSAYPAVMGRMCYPCASLVRVKKGNYRRDKCGVWHVVMTRGHPKAPLDRVPFYIRQPDGKAKYVLAGEHETYLTHPEIEFLRQTGWAVRVIDGWYWTQRVRFIKWMKRLETLRINDAGGPKGPMGVICKIMGNSAYGKTAEQLEGIDYLICRQRPEGYDLADQGDRVGTDTEIPLWYKQEDPKIEWYHVPQIACFVTAYVRIQVMKAALMDPEAFLYADTDACAFKRRVPALDRLIDPLRYGYWKLEADGDEHIFVTKKGYANAESGEIHAKGLNLKDLTVDDFRDWFGGKVPVQTQVQRQALVRVLQGDPMFKDQQRQGTRIERLANIEIKEGKIFPK